MIQVLTMVGLWLGLISTVVLAGVATELAPALLCIGGGWALVEAKGPGDWIAGLLALGLGWLWSRHQDRRAGRE